MVRAGGQPEKVVVQLVSGEYFQVLGTTLSSVALSRGRTTEHLGRIRWL
jgi:hypothetical protein